MWFSTIAIAGTFDRLHAGHEQFIVEAFKHGNKIIIGLTSDEMAGRKLGVRDQGLGISINIQSLKEREKQLTLFLQREKLFDRAQIVKIDDVYGPAADAESGIEALIVTRETMKGARMVNAKRRSLGLKPLRILHTPLVLGEDNKRIASTRIRLGEIDRWGRVYGKLPIFGKKLPEEIRLKLKEPIGRLIRVKGKGYRVKEGIQKGDLIRVVLHPKPFPLSPFPLLITVGDEVTRTVKTSMPGKPDIAIVDFRVNRKEKYTSVADHGYADKDLREVDTYAVKNPPGYIKKPLSETIKKSIKRYLSTARAQIIRVIGEEDLAGVPAILFAPLGSVVIYGQPPFAQGSGGTSSHQGIVIVEVTEEVKLHLLELVD